MKSENLVLLVAVAFGFWFISRKQAAATPVVVYDQNGNIIKNLLSDRTVVTNIVDLISGLLSSSSSSGSYAGYDTDYTDVSNIA